MLRAGVALTIMTAGLAVSSTPASALTNYTVTTTADVVATDGQLSLREAMIEADTDGDHSTITLGAGLTYELDLCWLKEPIDTGNGNFAAPDDDDANLDGDLDHSAPHDLTIYGNGSTIEQTCAYDRVIHSMHPETHLVIDDTTITGGDDAPELGDNIRSLGSLTLQDGTVVSDGAPFHLGGGYAVYVIDEDTLNEPTPTLTIDNSTISDNNETGALIEYGTLIVDDSIVMNNNGSGVAGSFSDVTVSGSTITGNLGSGIGGIDSPVDLSGSIVSDNGLGVSTSGNTPGMSPMVVNDSTIDGNDRGGLSCSYCASVTVTGSTISDNGALDGPLGSAGGISMFSYDANPGISIVDSAISGNRTPADGGAIRARFVDDFGQPGVLPTITIDNSNVFNNRSGIQSDGGAVYVERANVAIVNGSSFNDNRAKPTDRLVGGDGGALWVEEAITVDIADSFLTASVAHYDGGTVFADDVDVLRIENSLIADGRALGGGGGGLDLHEVDDVRITESSIVDNEAVQAGAGLAAHSNDDGYSIDFRRSTVARNTVTHGITGGGGVFASGELSELRMINSTVAHNTAFGPGAGVEVLGRGAVNLINTTMVYNKSSSGDVANLYHQSGPLVSWATVIAGGVGGGFDCGTFSGAVVSVGYNISGDNSCGFTGASDKTGVVGLGLGPLGDNGGPTHTLKPAKSSPLVNVIPLVGCSQPIDQRNVARPVGDRCDVGPVEVAGFGAGPDDFKNPGDDDRKRPDSITTKPGVDNGTVDPDGDGRLRSGQ